MKRVGRPPLLLSVCSFIKELQFIGLDVMVVVHISDLRLFTPQQYCSHHRLKFLGVFDGLIDERTRESTTVDCLH